MTTTIEAGIRPHRHEYIPEATEGITPANPTWELYSDCINKWSVRPSTNIAEKRCVGDADVSEFHKGAEDHELVIEYDLQKWINAAGDASFDGLIRDADNELQNTHSIVIREKRVTGGIDSAGRQTYIVAVGATPGKVKLTGEPESGLPVKVEITYTCEKIRSYQIDQPAATGVITVVSDAAGDITQSVVLEDEDAGATETLALNGTTPVVGITSFPDVDSLFLDAETVGDITITHTAKTIMVIKGQTTYDGIEGDLGVPSLGSGSHAAAVATVYEKFLGDTVTFDGVDVADFVTSWEMEVDNNIEALARNDSQRKRIIAGMRTVKVRATIFGESASHDSFEKHLQVTLGDIVWTLTGGTLTAAGCALTEPGEKNIEAEQTVMTINNVFTGKSLVAVDA